tara:strand:- start:855 stop:1220 length:366 start_codon:yes stop_codon:yes gene_type:complete
MTKSDGLGKRNVQTETGCNCPSNLGDLQSVRKAGPLMVFGKDEYLGFASQSTKGCGVKDSVPIPLKTSSKGISFFFNSPMTTRGRAGSTCIYRQFFPGVTPLSVMCHDWTNDCVAVAMSGS